MIQDLLYLTRAKPKKILDLVKPKGKSNDDIIFQKEREVINYFLHFQGFYPKQESNKKRTWKKFSDYLAYKSR